MSEAQRSRNAAQGVLDARAAHAGSTQAELYDVSLMADDLRTAPTTGRCRRPMAPPRTWKKPTSWPGSWRGTPR